MLICLRQLGIDRLIERLKEGYTFNKNSEDINAILTKARKHKHLKKLKKYCPGKPTSSKQEVVPFIKSLLALVGIKLKMEEQARNEQGIQERWYSLDRKAYHDIYRKEMLIAIEKQYHTWIEKEYIKPNWEYLKTEGTLPDEFKKVVKEQDIEIGEQKVSFEESIGESGIGFTDSEEGYINYTFPDKHILKIVRKYAKYLKGELNLEDISYSKEALDKAVQVIADIERYPTIKEELAPLFV
jgi:hypothetical protein